MSHIHVQVENRQAGWTKKVELADDLWPLRVGSSEGCAIVLESPEVAPENAIIERLGAHNYVKALPGSAVRANGSVVGVGKSVRFDDTPLEIGAFRISVRY